MTTPATMGSSEWAIPLGLQRTRHDGFPFTSELELWARLSGLLPRYADYSDRDTPDAECGRWFEPAVGARYAAQHELRWGTDIRPGPQFPMPGYTHAGISWGHTRPDYLVPKLERLMEAKCPRRLDEERWGEAGTDQVPTDYAVQVLGQLAICWRLSGVELADLAAFARAPGWGADRVWAVYHLRRDPAVERNMLDKLERWYTVHVLEGNPPEPDGSASAGDTLRGIWEGQEDRRLVAEPATLEDCYRLAQVRTAQREIAARRSEIEQRIQAAMGEATVLVSPDGERQVTWREDTNGRRRFRLWRKDVADDEG